MPVLQTASLAPLKNQQLTKTGFVNVSIEPTRIYSEVDMESIATSLENSQSGREWTEFLSRPDLPILLNDAKDFMASAFVRGHKAE